MRLTERAKVRLASSGRPIGLTELASQLAVSPAYLSDAFRRAEGIPLVRYQLRLRLIRALAELPRTDDLAQLALALGFSSHSHFTLGQRFAPPENLGTPVNSTGDEIEALVTPDETALVFAAKGRPDSLGAYDLYVSRRVDGSWQMPGHPAAPVNSAAWDFGPRLSPDGRMLFFSSNRGFGGEPLDRPLGFEELTQRLHASAMGFAMSMSWRPAHSGYDAERTGA